MLRKSIYVSFLISLLACVSCLNEEDIFVVEREMNPEEQVFGSELADGDLLKSMNIYVSDEMVDKLEEATKNNGKVNLRTFRSLTDQGVVEMRRLFQDAGEFEERTRAEGLHKWYTLKYEEGHSMTRASDGLLLEGIEMVEYCPKMEIVGEPQFEEYVSPVTKASSAGVFDDPMLDQQWHYYNNGKVSSSVSGCDINVVPVWKNYSTYNKYKGDIIVAIVDGGIDYKHEDLNANMWRNPEKTGENIYGYNFVTNSYVVTPVEHGTHVAGTVAAVNNNGIGVCGVAGGDTKKKIPGAKLMSCQIVDAKDNWGSGAEAIKWSADHGAVISQNSWGYPGMDYTPESLKAAVDYFEKYAGLDKNGKQVGPMKGGIVFFAAGNEGLSTSSSCYERIVSVTSVGADYKRAYYTCYGSWADVAAPGGDAQKGNQVLSTIPGNKYAKAQGSSMACPHVSGVAALALIKLGGEGYTAAALRKQLEDNATDISSFNTTHYIGKGLVNAYKTIGASGGKAPEVPTGLAASAQSNNIHFTVNVPKDSDDGIPSSIYIYYSTSDFTATKGKAFGMFYVEDLKPGDELSGVISGVEFETEYYIAALAGDLAGNMSPISSRVTVTTGTNSSPILTTTSPLDIKIKPHEKSIAEFQIVEPDGHFYLIELEPGSDAAVLDTVVRENPKIRLTPSLVPTGKYTAKLTVTDIYGLATTETYKYEVLPNTKPVLVKPFEDIIFNSKAAEVQTLTVSDYFNDADGEELSYAFQFSHPDVANMTYAAGKFQITSMNYGVSEITVTGTDVRGEIVSQSLKVLVRSDSKALSIYPNPVQDIMNIRTGGNVSEMSVKLISAVGSVAYEAQFQNISPFEPVSSDLSSLMPGGYTAVVVLDGVEYKQQIMKL